MANRFAIPEGWRLESSGEVSTLVGPEGDLRLDFVDLAPGGSVQQTALAAWKLVDPDFASTVTREVAAPPQDGWDEMHQVLYATPAQEARAELAIVRKLGGRAFVNLIRASTAGLSRRNAQLTEAIGSWKPEGFREVSLKDVAPVVWSEEKSARLKEFAISAMQTLQVPGAAMAIVQGGRVVYAEGLGVRDLGRGEPVTPRTRFMIGSSTKALTSLMMAKLVEQGKLSWSTPVVDLLPDFALADANVTRRLEIRHTVSASTGMPRQDLEFVFKYSGVTPEDRIAQMKTMRPTTGFGETFQYSNFLVAAGGYAAGRAHSAYGGLEKAFESAIGELVFRPLAMNNSCLRQEDAMKGEAALPHATNFEGGVSRIPLSIEMSVQSVAPAGAAWSTALDLARYLMLELGKGRTPGGERVVGEEFLLERRIKGIKIDQNNSYGLGLIVSDDSGLQVIHHGGNTFGFSSDMYFLPERDLGLVVLTNVYQASMFLAAMRQRVFELTFGAEPKAEKTVAAAVKMRQDGVADLRARVNSDAASMAWVDELAGQFECAELGPCEISRRGEGYGIEFSEWGGELGCEIEPGGGRLLRILSPPWRGGLKFVVNTDLRTLTLDGGQSKYVFQKR
uniref:Beta-lactamase n=1 Tax=Solibacter usitatus (strain Ellin6076) TaxID=234267 RepID=Q01SU2_SOLUE